MEHLRQYLSQHFSPGEEVELWNIWVGVDSPGCPPHFRGRLADFDMDTLAQFDAPVQNRLPGQCWLTITV